MPSRTARIETPLKRVMDAEGRSQTWLAKAIGVHRQQVWMWIHGIHVPEQASREAIARALGRNPDELWPPEPQERAA